LLFNAGCNEQVFLLNPEKICRISVLLFSRETQKTHTVNLKNYVTEPKARLL